MKSNDNRGRVRKSQAPQELTARPISDDGSPVAVAPSPGDRGASGLFTRLRQEMEPIPTEPAHRFFGPQHTFENRVKRGLGWLRDTPDFRDITIGNLPRPVPKKSEAFAAFDKVSKTISAAGDASLPKTVDNSEFCSPIEDQGSLGSCTANACMGMVEYMERRGVGNYTDGSRLFLYKTTRKLLGWTGDTGAFLRTTMKALVNFGIPPEDVWPYEISTFDQEPDPFMYAYAANTKAIQYLRLDAAGTTPTAALKDIKTALSCGYVAMFGFSVYSSLTTAADIPFPAPNDSLNGGHAVLAVGYDDDRPCVNGLNGTNGKGALLIRNSWGQGWGQNGYGWLPYDYILAGLANDFWTCYKLAWVDSGQFEAR